MRGIYSKQHIAAGTPIVLLYEKGDTVLPTSAASARAVRGRCFDPKRVATAPGSRAYSASSEHRVGSLLIVGQDKTQAHSSSSTRGSSTTPDGSHNHHIGPSRCHTESSWLRAERAWDSTRPLQSVHATSELVCRVRVVLVPYVMSTADVGHVVPLYNCIACKYDQVAGIYVKRSDLNFCLQPLAFVILKLGMIKVVVSNWNMK